MVAVEGDGARLRGTQPELIFIFIRARQHVIFLSGQVRCGAQEGHSSSVYNTEAGYLEYRNGGRGIIGEDLTGKRRQKGQEQRAKVLGRLKPYRRRIWRKCNIYFSRDEFVPIVANITELLTTCARSKYDLNSKHQFYDQTPPWRISVDLPSCITFSPFSIRRSSQGVHAAATDAQERLDMASFSFFLIFLSFRLILSFLSLLPSPRILVPSFRFLSASISTSIIGWSSPFLLRPL